MYKVIFAFLVGSAFFLTACADETQSADANRLKNDLAQRWELFAAERNGRQTESMTDAYLDLKSDGSAVVNLDGNGQNAQWTAADKTLTLSGTQSDYLSTDYTIKEMQDSILTLETELRNMPFLLQFKIATEED